MFESEFFAARLAFFAAIGWLAGRSAYILAMIALDNGRTRIKLAAAKAANRKKVDAALAKTRA
jgi:hypothetical protein